jgi:hypothetical protein
MNDPKKKFYEDMLGSSKDGSKADLLGKYGPKPPPEPEAVAAAPSGPVDPLADAEGSDPGILDRLLDMVNLQRKPKATPSAPGTISPVQDADFNMREFNKSGMPKTTPGNDPTRVDEYGQVVPSGQDGQYTLQYWKLLREQSPEWGDEKAGLEAKKKRGVRDEEE